MTPATCCADASPAVSVVAVNPEALNGVYGGTNAFVLAFSQNLRNELDGTGVTVQVVMPGATATAAA
jgi:short-subunit dehydrogenase